MFFWICLKNQDLCLCLWHESCATEKRLWDLKDGPTEQLVKSTNSGGRSSQLPAIGSQHITKMFQRSSVSHQAKQKTWSYKTKRNSGFVLHSGCWTHSHFLPFFCGQKDILPFAQPVAVPPRSWPAWSAGPRDSVPRTPGRSPWYFLPWSKHLPTKKRDVCFWDGEASKIGRLGTYMFFYHIGVVMDIQWPGLISLLITPDSSAIEISRQTFCEEISNHPFFVNQLNLAVCFHRHSNANRIFHVNVSRQSRPVIRASTHEATNPFVLSLPFQNSWRQLCYHPPVHLFGYEIQAAGELILKLWAAHGPSKSNHVGAQPIDLQQPGLLS